MTIKLNSSTQQTWLTIAEVTATCLASFAVLISLAINLQTYFTKTKGRIQLPINQDQPSSKLEQLHRELLEKDGHHGQLVEEVKPETFWVQVKTKKLILAIVILCSSFYQIYQGVAQLRIGADSLQLAYIYIWSIIPIYSAILAIIYCFTKDSTHRSITYQFFSIQLLSTSYWFLVTIGQYLPLGATPYIATPKYINLLINLGALLYVGMMPRRPLFHTDLSRLYIHSVNILLEPALSRKDAVNTLIGPSASLFSQLMSSWVAPTMLQIAKQDQVDVQELPALHAPLQSHIMAREMLKPDGSNTMEQSTSKWHLLWILYKPDVAYLALQLSFQLLLIPIFYLPHYALQNLLAAFDNPSARQSVVAWGCVMLVTRFVKLLLNSMDDILTTGHIWPRIRTHSSLMMYRKLLSRNMYAAPKRTEKEEKENLSKADILNLIDFDADESAYVPQKIWGLMLSIFEIALGGIYLWALMGVSGFIGLSALMMTAIPAYYLSKWQSKVFRQSRSHADAKTTLMQEAIQAISMIKMMATESFWFHQINNLRKKQMHKYKQSQYISFISDFVYSAGPSAMIVIAFAHYTLVAKKTLTPSIAFTTIAVFDELKDSIEVIAPRITDLISHLLAIDRIQDFLKSTNLDYFSERASPSSNTEESLYIQGSVAWDIDDGDKNVFKLHNLDIQFPRQKITLVAGRFGSGKTLLLLSLLGEAKLLEGKISYAHSEIMDVGQAVRNWEPQADCVAYAPQVPWLQSLSIRENILFGLPLNVERYQQVLYACALIADLELLEDGDLTEIGERGKILSGGQKARVSLARAVYSRASILVLDDVISAVDAQTAQHIVKHCFGSTLVTERTVIIASHAVEVLAPLAHQAVFLEENTVVWTGPGPKLLDSPYMSHLGGSKLAIEAVRENIKPLEQDLSQTDIPQAMKTSYNLQLIPSRTPKQVILEDLQKKGTVEKSHWLDIVNHTGNWVFWTAMGTILMALIFQPLARRTVLELWTGHAIDPEESYKDTIYWVLVYTITMALVQAGNLTFAVLRFYGEMHADNSVHINMLKSLLRAKMSFFTKTRAGSIMQRFGSDLRGIQQASFMLVMLPGIVGGVCVTIVTISVKGNWVFLAAIALLCTALFMPALHCVTSLRQLGRLEATLPGRINAIYSETIAGVAVIRAFGVQALFMDDLYRAWNSDLIVFMWTEHIQRLKWVFARVVDILLTAISLGIIFQTSGMSGAKAGFILVFVEGIALDMYSAMRLWKNMETLGVKLERTFEYCNLELEDTDPINSDGDTGIRHEPWALQQESWPSHGDIKVENLCVSYGKDLPNILHNVSFEVKGGECVGIVGATGGGKSTLAKAFFSFVDVTAGNIKIDNQDIKQLPLGLVRSRLGIIAQDPILFSGSLRLNLDIDGVYTDNQLYDALHQVQLLHGGSEPVGTLIEGCPSPQSFLTSSSTVNATETPKFTIGGNSVFANLDYEVKLAGENLSSGQKQLVVLARALLKKQKILIMDEATASVDSATDLEISKVVHQQFSHTTVLIIAHRLRTVMPCSKILVVDMGRIVQQGSPLELLQDKAGKFFSLCQAFGEEEYQQLLALAQRSPTKLLD